MIYLIITTSVNSKYNICHYKHRKTRYLQSIQSVLSIIQNDSEIKPIIVENNNVPTYLDELNCDVFYTNNNALEFPHKGFTELLDIQNIIDAYNMKDHDIVIKLTGRYRVLDGSFFNTIKQHCNDYDAFVKFYNVCTLEYLYNDCVLGLFAVKCKYLKNFHYNNGKSPECEFSEYVRANVKDKVMEIPNLQLECCFADDLRLLHV